MPPIKRQAWLITNHAPSQIVSGYENITGEIIAVDKGLEWVHDLGLIPALIIGDLDSLIPKSWLYTQIPPSSGTNQRRMKPIPNSRSPGV